MKKLIFIAFVLTSIFTFSSCEIEGCMQDQECVDNYNPKAKKDGDCSGCTIEGAYNYCSIARIESGNCKFIREFYTDNNTDGWVDLWVSDTAYSDDPSFLSYQGRLNIFPVNIPDCNSSDSTLTILRPAGEYYYEIETETGKLFSGVVIYREEGCSLLDVY
ncbi:MAG: hypothetical protein NWQ55_12670 [Salibacteraceae bacterium]|nr:hypothetical protein [Salibacteraceae bacterium]